jgi:hypothetical protein
VLKTDPEKAGLSALRLLNRQLHGKLEVYKRNIMQAHRTKYKEATDFVCM